MACLAGLFFDTTAASAEIAPACAARIKAAMLENVSCYVRRQSKAVKSGTAPVYRKCNAKLTKALDKVARERTADCTGLGGHWNALGNVANDFGVELNGSLAEGMEGEIAIAPKCQALRMKHASLLTRCIARGPGLTADCFTQYGPRYDAVAERPLCGAPTHDATSALALLQSIGDRIDAAIAERSSLEACSVFTGCTGAQLCIQGYCFADECAQNNGGCGPFSVCRQGVAGVRCGECRHGYEPDPVAAGECRPLIRATADPIYLGADVPPSCGVRIEWVQAMEVGVPAAIGYEIYRDGVYIADRALPPYEDWTADPGEHAYSVASVHADGSRTQPSAAALIDTAGCDGVTDPDAYRIKDASITPSGGRCARSNVSFYRPEVSPYPTFGVRRFLNGRHTLSDRDYSGGEFPLRDGWGGIDPLVPDATNLYGFAPFYDEEATKVGPIIEATVETESCADSGHMGFKQVAVVLLRPAEFPRAAPFDTAFVRGVFDDYEYSTKAFLDEVSYGQLEIQSTVFDWIELPDTIDQYCEELEDDGGVTVGKWFSCDTHRMWMDGQAALASEADVDLSTYDKVAYLYDGTTHGASAGGDLIHLSVPAFDTETVAHEYGHTMGLAHSGFWRCSGIDPHVGADIYEPRGEDCWPYVYGDGYDVMAVRLRHFNIWHKIRAGILDESSVQRINASGVYTLKAVASETPDGVMALKIPLYGNVSYMLEYRNAQGFDGLDNHPDYAANNPHTLVEGVAVWFVLDDFASGDTFAVKESWTAPLSIRPGKDFYDPYRNIRVSWIEQVDAEHARVSIEFE